MKNNKISENFLERIPKRAGHVKWTSEDGNVTLEIENKGIFNRVAQKFFKKPPVSFIHLDETGSFIWQLIDGKTSVMKMGEPLEKRFGDASHPLYERLAKFFQILESYNFIEWDKDNN